MLGDLLEKALSSIGITSERVEKLIGGPCGCKERRDKINALDAWARRVISGKVRDARVYLERLLE